MREETLWARALRSDAARRGLAGLVGLIVVGLAAQAAALDGYSDRRNVYGGLSVGGGYGLVKQEDDFQREGPGMHLEAVVGSGVTHKLLVGFETDWWSRTVRAGESNDYAFHHGSAGAVATFFPIGGFYADGGVGFAYGICSGTVEGSDCAWQELGVAAEVGAGFQFWFNGTLAGSVDLAYNRHFYSHSTFDTVNLGFGLRWY